jgi:hypothetical protein
VQAFPRSRPNHNRLENLSWGTYAQNAADMDIHGTMPRGERSGAYTKPHRVPRGERCGAAKLNATEVWAVWRLCHVKGLRRQQIREWFHIGIAQVNRIGRGCTWRHLNLAALQDPKPTA